MSICPITFNWKQIVEPYVIQVEPSYGEIGLFIITHYFFNLDFYFIFFLLLLISSAKKLRSNGRADNGLTAR